MKKFLAILTIASLLSPLGNSLAAQGFPPPEVNGDDYYPEYRVAPYVGPTVALLIIAAAVTVAVLLSSSDSDHSHVHGHGS